MKAKEAAIKARAIEENAKAEAAAGMASDVTARVDVSGLGKKVDAGEIDDL